MKYNTSFFTSLRKIIISIFLLGFALLFLCCPSQTCSYAKEGLIFFGLNMFPALFPFLLLTNLAIDCEITPLLSKLFHPLFSFLFGSSREEDFCILCGLFGGFPLGALTVASAIESNLISKSRGRYLLFFNCLPGPVYLINFLLPLFEKSSYKILFLLLFYGIPFLLANLVRFTNFIQNTRNKILVTVSDKMKSQTTNKTKCKTAKIMGGEENVPTASPASFSAIFNCAVEKSVSTMLKLGGIVIFFYCFRTILSFLPGDSAFIKTAFRFFLEINSGVQAVSALKEQLPDEMLLSYLTFFPFCGLSCFMQAYVLLMKCGLKAKDYLIPKLLHCLCWGVVCLFLK